MTRPAGTRPVGKWSAPGSWLLRVIACACCALGVAAPASTRAQGDVAERAQGLIVGLDLDEARAVLASADPDDPRVALERARLALYELDCDGSAAIFGRSDVQGLPGAAALADIARGCQRVTAALVADKDAARGIEIRWQDEGDRPLAPMLMDTVVKARDALTRDLGVDWPRPTRVVVVRDLLSLSAMTGLPYASATTTGTVAVAKWGRVTLLSPRATPQGFPWRDTVTHELTHLAVTRASRDRAPLWLQEGVAKREEVRWRAPGPFDGRPAPLAIVQHAADLGRTVPLDKLGASIAMLPSADSAMIAFAEVTSFVGFYADAEDARVGGGALPRLLRLLAEPDSSPDRALLAASGADLKAWDDRWHAYVASAPRAPLPAFFGLGEPKVDRHERDQARDFRDRTRLAQLLMSRGHAEEALQELDRIELARPPPGHANAASEAWQEAVNDPGARWLRGRALEAAGRPRDGRPLVADTNAVVASFGPWWALRGRWARADGDEELAASSFEEALSADPLDAEVACETIDPAQAPGDGLKALLCAAARARREPPFDGD